MENFKSKKCSDKDCSKRFKQYNSLQKYCSPACSLKNAKPKVFKLSQKINRVSDKRKIQELQYSVDRKVFLEKPENRICFIEGCNKPSTTIEHRAGRWGSNYLNKETWAGCCLEHNIELENNPELSKKYQLSKITGKPKL